MAKFKGIEIISLSGSDYGYYFIIIGVLALVLVILHTARRAAQYNENVNVVTQGYNDRSIRKWH